MTEDVGILLDDGPFAGHRNAYELDFPPPEEVVAFRVNSHVAIAGPESLQRAKDFDTEASLYRRVAYSRLMQTHPGVIRGAVYKLVDDLTR